VAKRKVATLTEAKIEEALTESRGVIKAAANLLGVERSSLSRRIKKSEALTEVRDNSFSIFVDDVEKAYYDKMMETNDKIMMIFFLKCHGKERGWVERQEITGKDGEALGQVVAPVRQLNAEEWSKQNQIELKVA
jgi:hypothetical protein